MPEFSDLVKSDLKESGRKEVEELWDKIYNSYEEGGPNTVEEVILKQLSQLKKGASREIKDIREISPKKKK